MKIVSITAGAGGMYCGSCLHDNTLAAALLARGEDVLLTPVYTPTRTDEADVSRGQVFCGGINVYLQQLSGLFRRTPRWVDRWLDHPALLRLATRNAGAVDPAKLGPMTVSMLRGEEGNQRKEVLRLCEWIRREVRPDVVHLPNAMMLGLARTITADGGPPVVCTLSGEDIFLEKLVAPYYEQARALLRERASEVAAFVALNSYYADAMAEYLAVDRGRIEVVPHGLNLEGHPAEPAAPGGDVRRVGFLARVCQDKGLHLLVEAAELLAGRDDLPSVEVVAAGYLSAGDRRYLAGLEERCRSGPLAERFLYVGELDRADKIAFLRSLDVLALPTVYRESKGLSVLEAMASGVPVVVPAHGAFPELVAQTGGGLLHEPHNAADLAEKLAQLLQSPEEARLLGQRGHAAIREHFHADRMAEGTLRIYRRILVDERR